MSDIAIKFNLLEVLLYFAVFGSPGLGLGGAAGLALGWRYGYRVLGALAGALLGYALWMAGWWFVFR